MIKIHEVIPQKNILILSPHYDDVVLTFGGYIDSLKKHNNLANKNIRIINIFSRSCYQAHDDIGNQDHSLKRVQFATGIRLLEDLNCLDDLLGFGNYSYEVLGERECVLRAKPWKKGEEFEFPQGNRETFDEEEWGIFERLKKRSEQWLREDDTAVLIPLGVKEHIDHIILREAVVDAWKEQKGKSQLYFGEDQPYTGLADSKDWDLINTFLNQFKLQSKDYEIDIDRKADLVMKHYPSQVEESYEKGVRNRSASLQKVLNINHNVERIYSIL
ncbi:MAG: hypothetical protein COA79_08680 [Planctomycetota bacterium]|nr:MAG: hypothetical protein COA79_08680 [Planctomycetota bacterium]